MTNPIINTMARRLAVKAIERELRAKGEKVAYIPRAIINRMARAHLQEHPELLAEAERVIGNIPALAKMAAAVQKTPSPTTQREH